MQGSDRDSRWQLLEPSLGRCGECSNGLSDCLLVRRLLVRRLLVQRLWVQRLWVRASGFTLVECLVVLAIVALLAALTLPSYAALQRRALAREGAFHLTMLAALQEQLRLTKGHYQSAQALLHSRPLPVSLRDHYHLSVELDNPSGFLLRLVPLAQDSHFPLLSIDGLGRRSPRDLWP